MNVFSRKLVWLVCASMTSFMTVPAFADFPFFSLRRAAPTQISIGVSPLTGFVGVTQYVFINGCAMREPIYYPNAYVAGTLTVQASGMQSPCYFPIDVLQIRPEVAGTGRIILNSPTGILADISTQVVVPVTSTLDLDGMWYDDSTNGAGISFFRSPQTGQIFGTWFLYASPPVATAQTQDTPRWFSLQNTAWTNGGNVLEGTIFETRAGVGNLPTPCTVGNECPRQVNSTVPVGSFRFVMSSATNGRIEAFDTTGTSVFSSNLQRLEF